jgi:CBS domain containing-hemolysin-like protein
VTAADLPLLLIAVLLLVVAAVLAGADAAVSRVSRVAVETFVRDERRGADRLARIVAEPAPYIALVLLVRMFCELGAACLVAVSFVHAEGSGWAAIVLAALVVTVLDYVLVGVAARTLGRQHAPGVALRTAGLMTRLTAVFGPLPRILILLGNALTPGKGYRDGPFASEAELRDLVDLAEERDVIERSERDMIASVFELGNTLAREVMVPRTDMVFIERQKSVRQALQLALRSGFSRMPVVGDNVDDVVGIAFLKDLVRREHEGRGDRQVDTAMRPAVFVPDTKPADVLLREMQAERVHLVIVIDEYGGTAGLVTIEDVLEEIVGEITDEYDVETPPVVRLDDRTVRVVARLPVDDLAELFDIEVPNEDEVETVGGLLASALGRVPIPGARAEVAGLTLTAEASAGRRNRIGTVLVHQDTAADRAADGAPHGDAETTSTSDAV